MTEPNGTKSGGGFFATILIVVGIAWMTLTGLCTAGVLISSIIGNPSFEMLGAIPVLALIGAICIGPGWLLWMVGRSMKRRRNGAGG